MKIITSGHKYELSGFENKENTQTIQFIEKEQDVNNPIGKCTTVNDGTTSEEVLEMLIDRAKYLQEQLASRENAIAITKMEEALLWLNKRTEDRKKRNVEGKHIA